MEKPKEILFEYLDKHEISYDTHYIDDSDVAFDAIEEAMEAYAKYYHRQQVKSVDLAEVGKSLPIGDVEILLKGLEHIGKWGDEEEERWDDPGDCAMDTLSQYRYSMSVR